jgi:hypothetical protein
MMQIPPLEESWVLCGVCRRQLPRAFIPPKALRDLDIEITRSAIIRGSHDLAPLELA